MRINIQAEKPVVSVGCVLLVAIALGCATSPPSRYYSLQAISQTAEPYTAEIALVVGPWLLPQYLNRVHLVTRTSSAELEVADFDRWAEPVEDNFSRVVAMNLGTLLPSSQIYEFPLRHPKRGEKFVRGRVYRLDVDESGKALLDVAWQILDANDRALHGLQRVQYEEQASPARSHDAGVQAMSRTISRFSRDIATAAADLGE